MLNWESWWCCYPGVNHSASCYHRIALLSFSWTAGKMEASTFLVLCAVLLPFLPGCQTEECARTLSDPQWRRKFIYKEDYYFFREAFKASIWPALKKSFGANVIALRLHQRRMNQNNMHHCSILIYSASSTWTATCLLKVLTQIHIEHGSESRWSLRTKEKDSAWDSSSLADDPFQSYSVGKQSALNASRSALVSPIRISGPKAIMTGNSSKWIGWFEHEPPVKPLTVWTLREL